MVSMQSMEVVAEVQVVPTTLPMLKVVTAALPCFLLEEEAVVDKVTTVLEGLEVRGVAIPQEVAVLAAQKELIKALLAVMVLTVPIVFLVLVAEAAAEVVHGTQHLGLLVMVESQVAVEEAELGLQALLV
jgi:hypothetical protein